MFLLMLLSEFVHIGRAEKLLERGGDRIRDFGFRPMGLVHILETI